ncbi:hypothetical protein K438DRAFT_1979172 [Mycena galopus ATCC 62051]|nr:hypothetical protein K438DRAFT_1979172 [Mycena galopus ATCC 62051]
MQLQRTTHYTELLDEAVKKGTPDAKLDITELPSNNVTETSKEDNEQGPSKKAKKRQATSEEEELVEIIVQLKIAHHCSDRTCYSRICFISNPTAVHVPLTPLHLSTWAAAILAKTPDVDVQNPPAPELEKMFWPILGVETQDDIDDIASLAARRKSLSVSKTASTSVTVNNDLSAFANLLGPLLAGSAPHGSLSCTITTPVHSPRRPLASISPIKTTPMMIAEFCHIFNLSEEIAAGLALMELDGPHLLKFLENSVLDKYLKIGQRLSLCFAESRWKKGMKGSPNTIS